MIVFKTDQLTRSSLNRLTNREREREREREHPPLNKTNTVFCKIKYVARCFSQQNYNKDIEINLVLNCQKAVDTR